MTDKTKNYPKSVGIIMDGNRRWARAKGLDVFKGHEAGYERFKDFVGWAKEFGVRTVYVYAFSTENWNRSKSEVGYLMKLFANVVGGEAKNLVKKKVRVKFVGQTDRFSPSIRFGIRNLERATAKFAGINLVICVSYGGRAEILSAIKKLTKEKSSKELSKIDEGMFEKYLWTAGFPDPELIIRTSGETRTSNFLPWQSVYSEWFFSKSMWPAFTKKEFEKILDDFSSREIRRGR